VVLQQKEKMRVKTRLDKQSLSDMYKTDADKAAKIINSLRPSLIFVTLPYAIDSGWVNQFKNSGYSCISAQHDVDAKKLQALVKTRYERGKVLLYGWRTPEELEIIMPDEYAHFWFYPVRQTVYHVAVAEKVAANDLDGLPKEISTMSLTKITKITKACHDNQKKAYEAHLAHNDRIFVVLCCN
jgi:hypothetical protein